jgi:hypothetical protein
MIAARFHAYAIARLLEDHRECVIDFGAGHSALSDESALHQVETLLANYPNVFLLLPSHDPTRSEAILAQRCLDHAWLQEFVQRAGWNLNSVFLRHPANFALAKQIVYTEGRSPEETRDEILTLIENRPKARGRATRTRQKSEMIAQLKQALYDAEESRLETLTLVTGIHLGDLDCWARIAEEQLSEFCTVLAQLGRDIGCTEGP